MREGHRHPARIAMLASGGGAGLQALLTACHAGELKAEVIALAADRKCPAIGIAETVRLPIVFHPWGYYRQAGKHATTYDRDLAAKILLRGADYVVLDGWKRPLSAAFFEHFPRRAIYLHLGLRGRFPGTNAVEDTLEAFQRGEIRQTGVKVLFSSGGDIESDPLIRKVEVPIEPQDSLERLSVRLEQAGTKTLIEATRLVLENKVRG